MDDDELLTMDPKENFDHCILGIAERFEKGGHMRFVVYDRACVIEQLSNDMDNEAAEEYFEFNIAGALLAA